MTKQLEDSLYHSAALNQSLSGVTKLLEQWKKPHPVDEATQPLTEEEIESTRRYLAKGGDVPWASEHVARLVKTIDSLKPPTGMVEMPYDPAIGKGDTVNGITFGAIRYRESDYPDPLTIILKDAQYAGATHYMLLPKQNGRYAVLTSEGHAKE